ncbi:MAG: hypothetical protein ACI9GW_000801 [Halieaceae bacterium]|jgi:hypothetical protein
MITRAQRTLQYCFDSLQISQVGLGDGLSASTEKGLQAKASREYEKALAPKSDIANGLVISSYLCMGIYTCAVVVRYHFGGLLG